MYKEEFKYLDHTKPYKRWYRPIGICNGSDYIQWQETQKPVLDPGFIGYLEVVTDNDRRPQMYGENIVQQKFVFFRPVEFA